MTAQNQCSNCYYGQRFDTISVGQSHFTFRMCSHGAAVGQGYMAGPPFNVPVQYQWPPVNDDDWCAQGVNVATREAFSLGQAYAQAAMFGGGVFTDLSVVEGEPIYPAAMAGAGLVYADWKIFGKARFGGEGALVAVATPP